MNINVHIERLILDGLPVRGSDGSIIQTAVETELTRLLAEQYLNRLCAGTMRHLSGGSIPVIHDSGPTLLGHQIAQAVYGSLTPAPASPHETNFKGERHG